MPESTPLNKPVAVEEVKNEDAELNDSVGGPVQQVKKEAEHEVAGTANGDVTKASKRSFFFF